MSKVETTAVDLDLAESSLERLLEIRKAFSVDLEGARYDLSYFDCFVKWSTNYCQAAKIDLR